MAEAAPSDEKVVDSEIYKVVWEKCIPNDENARNKITTEVLTFDESYPYFPSRFEAELRSETKFAYFYRYFTWTVYAVSACWKHFHSEKEEFLELYFNILSGKNLHVVSFGGGSASDVVGLCQWMNNSRRGKQRPRVACTLADKYDWLPETRDLLAELEISLKYDMLNPIYTKCDFFNGNFDPGTKNALDDAHLVTFVNFFGNVVADAKDTEKRLREVLSSLPVDTLIMFMDSASNAFASSIFRTAVEDCQLYFVSRITDLEIVVPAYEKSRMDANHLPDVMPQTVELVNACLLFKTEPLPSTKDGQPK